MQTISSHTPSATASKPNPLKFGCRMFAYMTPQAYPGQDEFLRQCLLTGGNSLKRQNQLRLGESGNSNVVARPDYKEQMNGPNRKAGWGIAIPNLDTRLPGPTVVKEALPTWHVGASFNKFAEQAAQSKPPLLLAHLREAYPHQTANKKNTHPFSVKGGDWLLMQHGDVPRRISESLHRELYELRYNSNAENAAFPTGDTDTEKITCFFANNLLLSNHSVKVETLPTAELRDLFQETMNSVITWKEKDDHQYVAPDSYPGSYNMMLSDGNRILATRYGKCPLYLGLHTTTEGNTEYVLATDRMQPTSNSGLQPIDWKLIPNNKLLTLEKQPLEVENGQIKVTLQDLVYDPTKPKPKPVILDLSPKQQPQTTQTKPAGKTTEHQVTQTAPNAEPETPVTAQKGKEGKFLTRLLQAVGSTARQALETIWQKAVQAWNWLLNLLHLKSKPETNKA